MQWNLYKVSSSKDEYGYILDGDFAPYEDTTSLDFTDTSTTLDVANTLENYAIVDDIEPVSTGVTNSSGTVIFGDLEKGLYLVSGKSVTIDNKKYTPSAMLVDVAEDHETAFELLSYPKFTVKTLSGAEVKYSVKKVWLNDDENLDERPDDIIVELYKNDSLSETIHLNDSNDWQYNWTSNDAVEWRVKEIQIPDDYMVVYRTDEVVYMVVNMHSSSDSTGRKQVTSRLVTYVSGTTTTSNTGSGNGTGTGDGADVSKTTTTAVSGVSAGTTTTTSYDGNNVSKTTTTSYDGDDISKNTTTTTSNGDDSNSLGSVTTTTPNGNGSTVSGSGSNNGTGSGTGSNYVGGNSTTVNSKTVNSTNKSNSSNSTESVSSLPQTGQLWLPVPILALCGIVLIAIGLQLKSQPQQ
jgi:hypothetical protein